MAGTKSFAELSRKYIVPRNHSESDYFGIIQELVAQRNEYPATGPEYCAWQEKIDQVYELVADELASNQGLPVTPVSFGTSGWRGILGKDLFAKSVAQVTRAIIAMYEEIAPTNGLGEALGVKDIAEAQTRGCVVGFDNRFGGELLARRVIEVLTAHGFVVHYAGEATTGTLSAAVLGRGAAFSINLTPSHNPLQYGGYKYNAADAGPAAAILTSRITAKAREIMASGEAVAGRADFSLVRNFDALAAWIDLVRANGKRHGLDYDAIMAGFAGPGARRDGELAVAVDCVHGASRLHMAALFNREEGRPPGRLILLRANRDPTFGGIAPEPSTVNLAPAVEALKHRPEPLKLGAIIDPDGDRIRFTDGTTEISMNKFGAMAYHFLHEIKKKRGLVAKTVATSNFANALAAAFGEEVFETRVGFKEFKPVIDRALVCFEESDGITVIGHTPEKDAYIGLLLALDMVQTLGKNLGDYLRDLEDKYGSYQPAAGAVVVKQQGALLTATLANLAKFAIDTPVKVGEAEKRIVEVIDIDGRKMIFADGSWIMIRPSGTEPKVRYYVEARSVAGKAALITAAKEMLAEIGLL